MNMKTIKLHIDAILELMTLSWLKYRENKISAKHIIIVFLLIIFPYGLSFIASPDLVIVSAVICLAILTSFFLGFIFIERQARKRLRDDEDAKQQIQDDIDNAGSC